MRGLLGRFRSDQRGASAVIVVLSMTMILSFAALAIDLGSVFLQTRKLQGMADLAAMAASRDLPKAALAAQATVTANGVSGVQVITQTGNYTATPGSPVATRFVVGGAPMNAARVQLKGTADLYFGSLITGGKGISISRVGTAARTQLASFSIGSRLASLNGGIANSLLTGLTGSKINLSVMDYNNLASANVDLLSYVKALRTKANLQAASFDDALNAQVTLADALSVLGDQVNVNAKGPLNVLAQAGGNTKIQLDQLIDLGPYGGQDTIIGSPDSAVTVDSMTLATAILQLANKNRQVKLDLSANVPGLAGVNAWLAIGERPNNSPWMTVTASGDPIIRTAQTRLYVETQIGGVGSLLGGLGITVLKLPIYVELASGEAKLSAITCASNASGNNVALDVRPSIGSVSIGEINKADLNNFQKTLTVSPANVVDLLLIKVQADSTLKIGGASWQTTNFAASEIGNGTIKTVRTNDAVQALAASLVGKMNLNVNLLGLGLNLSGITAALGQTLAVAAPLIDGVVNGLTNLLGVGLGEADVQVNGVRCGGAALVA